MRVRSLLLGICMIVVPAVALFSHHLPPGLAAAVRATLTRRMAAWSQPEAVPEAAREPVESPAVAAASPSPAPMAAIASPPPPPSGGADRRVVEDRLLELGAAAIECQPLPGGDGTMLASCRMAVDAGGQLQRVFQATGGEPTAALERLLADVQAWRQRTAAGSRAMPR